MNMMSTNEMEVFFENCLMQYDNYLQSYLSDLLIPDEVLKKAVVYVLSMPSKKFRAQMVYATGQIYNIPLQKLHPLALAIEMIHAYSLVHDDLPAMDNDDFRRGMPSCHKAFDEATAILTGNTLHHLAFSHLLEELPKLFSESQCLICVKTILHYIGPQGILSGQSMDLRLLSQPQLTLEQLTEIHHLKTSALLQAIVDSIWVLGNKNQHQEKMFLNQFVQHLGLSYQMFDDYGDVYATNIWGKQQSSDNANEKNTYVKFYQQNELKEAIIKQIAEAKHSLKKLAQYQHLEFLVDKLCLKIYST